MKAVWRHNDRWSTVSPGYRLFFAAIPSRVPVPRRCFFSNFASNSRHVTVRAHENGYQFLASSAKVTNCVKWFATKRGIPALDIVSTRSLNR